MKAILRYEGVVERPLQFNVADNNRPNGFYCCASQPRTQLQLEFTIYRQFEDEPVQRYGLLIYPLLVASELPELFERVRRDWVDSKRIYGNIKPSIVTALFLKDTVEGLSVCDEFVFEGTLECSKITTDAN